MLSNYTHGQTLLYRCISKITIHIVKQFLTNTVLAQCGISKFFPPFRFYNKSILSNSNRQEGQFGNFRGFEVLFEFDFGKFL